LVEYALILPLLLLLTLGVLEFGIIIYQYNAIGNAAREGARVGIIRANNDGAIEAAARAMTTALEPADLAITIDRSQAGLIEVRVDYTARPFRSHVSSSCFRGLTMTGRAETRSTNQENTARDHKVV
jgi:Flp pilus assembly protein TadG